MNAETTMPVLKLKPKEERRLQFGHCWVFSNELSVVDTALKAGSLCKVIGHAAQPVGVGFFNPHSLISVRLLTRGAAELEPDFVSKRLKAAIDYRKSLGLGKFCRLCFSEADNLPGLIVDGYGDYLVVEFLSAGMDNLKAEVLSALDSLCKPKGILLKNDSEFRKLEGLACGQEIIGEVPDVIFAEEDGLKYTFPVKTGQKTGFYYDQRENRLFLAPFFKGRRVLDLYSYVGGFALRAAASGAGQVWGVESSKTAVEFAEKNAELNGFSGRVVFHKADAEETLNAFAKKELPETPDFVVLDPPNLVKNRKNLTNALKLYVRLNELALRGLPSGGFLATANCSHHVSREMFEGILARASARAGRKTVLVEFRGQAKDHPVLVGMPETSYLQFALLRVL